MNVWKITDADRTPNGHIRAPGFDDADTSGTAFAAALSDSLAAVGASPTPATEEPAPDPTAPRPRPQFWLAAAGVVLVALLVALIVTALPAPAPAPVRLAPTAAPAISATVADLTPAPAALPRLPRAIVAYSAPAGEPIGAIEAGRVYTPTATYGAAWLQLDVAESGRVWTRAGDLPEVASAGLPDLAPPATAIPLIPTAAPAPVVAPEQPSPAPPTATPAPTVNGTATIQAIQARLDQTSTSVYATAAALGVPGGVKPKGGQP